MKKKIKKVASCFMKQHILQRLGPFCFFLLPALFAGGQASFPDSLQAGFARYRAEVLQEKVFVHTDKNFYLAGETLWFKAYVVNALTNRETDFSKVVYAELLDGKGKPVAQAMINNRQSAADGSFLLPLSLQTGMYMLRAYTAWMKNFDEAGFFQTPVQIVNTSRRPDWFSLQTKDSFAVQFFPEGGNLVEGIPAKMGFQLMDRYGHGVEGEGFVVKNGTDTVAHFRPFKFGIGSFGFIPQKEAVYKAVVRLPNGERISAALPAVYKEGYVLRVTDAGKEEIKVSVATNHPFSERPVYLVVHSKTAVPFSAAKIIAAGKAEWLINKKTLSDGINVLTLFDGERKPVCERLYFKRPVQKLNVTIASDAKEYGARSKVSLSLSTQSNTGDTVPSRLSLSVFLLDSLQGLSQPSIEEYLWLTSEVKGRIESPGYYFAADDEETKTALDNLLLTQGWRRFVPDGTTNPSSFSFLPEYEGAVVKGKVTDKRTGHPASGLLCYLSVPGERFYTANAVSDESGGVSFVVKDVYGAVELAVQTAGADSNLRVDLQPAYSPDHSSVLTPRFVLSEAWKEALANRHLAGQLSASFATAAMQRFLLPQLDTLPFYGKADTRYNLDEYTRFPGMEEVMREITAEVFVKKEKDSFRYSVLNLPYKTHFEAPPLVLFDGVPVANTARIISFDPLKVKRIDVVARKYFWGATVNNGIVSYATYDGNLGGFELDPSVLLVEYNGLQVKREFYSPAYAATESLRSREPDSRNVLLWDPSITTSTESKTVLNFYTSDIAGRYAITVQGISADGLAGSKTVIIDVK